MRNSPLLPLLSRHTAARSQETCSSKQWVCLNSCYETFVYKTRGQDFNPWSRNFLHVYISSHEIKEWKHLQVKIIFYYTGVESMTTRKTGTEYICISVQAFQTNAHFCFVIHHNNVQLPLQVWFKTSNTNK